MFSSYTLFPNTFGSLEAETMDVEFTDLEAGSITGKTSKLSKPYIFTEFLCWCTYYFQTFAFSSQGPYCHKGTIAFT